MRSEGRHDEEPTPPKKPSRERSGPQPDDEECVAQRKLASDAFGLQKWATVLAATRERACWRAAMSKRAVLMARAYYHTGRFSECAKLKDTSSPELRNLVEMCKKKAEASP